jgi:hypothetical protein
MLILLPVFQPREANGVRAARLLVLGDGRRGGAGEHDQYPDYAQRRERVEENAGDAPEVIDPLNLGEEWENERQQHWHKAGEIGDVQRQQIDSEPKEPTADEQDSSQCFHDAPRAAPFRTFSVGATGTIVMKSHTV